MYFKNAILSVFNKKGIIDLAKFLISKNVKIFSTGGTYDILKNNNIEVFKISEYIDFPEILEGRVKSLHPKIHGGILAKNSDIDQLEKLNITKFDLVVCNLYPFFENVNKNFDTDSLIEYIDIGGPSMIRSASKNFKYTTILTDPSDYDSFMDNFENIDYDFRFKMAAKAFNLTSAYDASISEYFNNKSNIEFPDYFAISYKKEDDLRYGENPHQKAAFYKKNNGFYFFNDFETLNGKKLSFNNLRDVDIAWKTVSSFSDCCCVALKHNTPCGIAIGKDTLESFNKSFECDPVSIFGGIVAFNRTIDFETAKKLKDIFLEIVIATDFEDIALDLLKKKKNLRILKVNNNNFENREFISLNGGLIIQNTDLILNNELNLVTKKKNYDIDLKEIEFAFNCVKFVKSNAIVVCDGFQTVGIGGGEVSRIWAAEKAFERSIRQPKIMASDAFFPFKDVVELAYKNGIKIIVQPGGSIRDQDSIDFCNENNIDMYFTNMRHFKH